MKTILFADDSKNIREYCRTALEEEGYRVVLACNGMEAIRLFRAEAPDLAILDICMPGTSGLDALEGIKQIEPGIPVILFTAYDEDCVRDRRGTLALACVEKSEDLSELKRAVANALRTPCRQSHDPSSRLGLPPLGCNTGSS